MNRKDIVVTSVGELVDYEPEEHLLEGLDLEELWLRRSLALQVAQAAKNYKRLVDEQMATLIGKGNSVRLGDEIYTAKPTRRYKIDNGERLLDWLGEDARRAFNPTTARVGVLKQLAHERELDPMAVLETFGAWVEEGCINSVPVSKAPKRLQHLEHLGSTDRSEDGDA